MFGLKYGNIPQSPEPDAPVKIAPEIARKRLREKLAKQRAAREEVTRLEAAEQRAGELLHKAEGSVQDATTRLEAARHAHAGKMATALSAGSDPGGASPAVAEARAKLKEAEDYRDAAAGALRKIEGDLETATAAADALKSVAYEFADVVGDDVDGLLKAASGKLLELLKMRSALAYCLRAGICRDAINVNGFLNSVVLHAESNPAPLPQAMQDAMNIGEWAAAIERMKSDPDAKFPVLK
jgi:hypothetical protein